MSHLHIFDQTSLARIIAYLSGGKRASITDLKRDIGASQSAIYKAIPILLEYNLVLQSRFTIRPYTLETWLTPKGEQIAQLLIQINQILLGAS